MEDDRLQARTIRMWKPTLEVHVPGSPTPVFLNMVRCLALSLRHFGGAYRDAPVIFTVGDRQEDHTLADRHSWLRDTGIEVRWVPPATFRERVFFATGNQRFQYRHKADVVLMLDADTLIAGPLDELIDDVARHGHLAGVIAHARPFRADPSMSWEGVFHYCGLERPRLDHEYTGWGYMDTDPRHRHCPPYFNAGVLCGPGPLFNEIGAVIDRLARQAAECTGELYFQNQMALALAIAKLGVPTRALPMRYNFPNDPLLEALHADEIPHARILHMLRNNQSVNKNDVFAASDRLASFIDRTDLRVINRRAQDVIRAIWPAYCQREAMKAAA
jgi:hypothetical protein